MPPKKYGNRGAFKKAASSVGPKRARNLRVFRRSNRGTAKDTSHTNAIRMSTTAMNRVPRAPFKDNYICSLSWDRNTIINTNSANSAVVSSFVIPNNINNIFNASGILPTGYTQIAAIYNYVEVIGIKYQVTFQDPSNDGVCVGISLQGGNDPNGFTLPALQTRNRTMYDYVANTGTQVKVFSGYLKPYQVLGLNKIQYLANVDNFGVPTDSTTQLAKYNIYLNYWASNSNIYAIAPTINCNVKLELLVKCYGVKALA